MISCLFLLHLSMRTVPIVDYWHPHAFERNRAQAVRQKPNKDSFPSLILLLYIPLMGDTLFVVLIVTHNGRDFLLLFLLYHNDRNFLLLSLFLHNGPLFFLLFLFLHDGRNFLLLVQQLGQAPPHATIKIQVINRTFLFGLYGKPV